jgi:hypothetical protein
MAKGIFSFGRGKKPKDPPPPEVREVVLPPAPLPVPKPSSPPPPPPPPEIQRARTIPSEELFKILEGDLTPWMNTDKVYKGIPYRLAVAYGKKHRDAHGHEIVHDSNGVRCASCKFQILY